MKILPFLFLIVLVICPSFLHAEMGQKQESQLEQQLNLLSDKAAEAIEQNKTDAILFYMKTILDVLDRLEQNQSQRVVSTLEGVRIRKVKVLQKLGQYDMWEGNFTSSLDYLNKALNTCQKLDDPSLELTILSNLGGASFLGGDALPAIDYYERAIRLCRKVSERKLETMNINDLAIVYMNMGDLKKSLHYLSEAQELNRKLNDPEIEGMIEQNFAQLHVHFGNYKKAAEKAETAIQQFMKIGSYERVLEAIGTKADCYRQMGNIRMAYETFLKGDEFKHNHAAEIGQRFMNTYYQYWRIFALDVMALDEFSNYSKIEDQEKKDMFTKVMAHSFLVFFEEDSDAKTFYSGIVSLNLGNFQKSLDAFEAVLSKFGQKHDAANRFVLYTGLGLAKENLGDLNGAKEAYLNAVEVVEQIRFKLPSYARSRFFSKKEGPFRRIEPFEGLVRVYSKQGDNDQAFFYAESIKARMLLEILAKTRSSMTLEIDSALSSQEKQLQQRLRHVSREIDGLMKTNDQAGLAQKESELKQVSREQKNFIRQLRSQFPTYAAIHYPEAIKPAAVPLMSDETMIEFEVSDDSTQVFVVRTNSLKSYRSEITRSELEQKMKDFRAAFEGISTSEDLKLFNAPLGKELYSILLAKALVNIPKGSTLIIVPDEILGSLPFESLVTKSSGTYSFAEGPKGPYPKGISYLADHYEIAYTQSASAFTLMRNLKPKPSGSNRVLVVGDPIFSTNDPRFVKKHSSSQYSSEDAMLTDAIGDWKVMGIAGTKRREGQLEPEEIFPRLEKTGALAQKIYSRFGQASHLMTGFEAEEKKVKKQNLKAYRYAVFATHGILADTVPFIQEPALVLNQVDRAAGEDGFLTMSEVMQMKLNADLALLTACETGRGELVSGEGVMGMGRAFQYAGAKNVLMSLWSVSEDSTTELSAEFLQKVADGSKPIKALSDARKSIRKDGYEHPFYWAGFILMAGGQTEAMDYASEAEIPAQAGDAESKCKEGVLEACVTLGKKYMEGEELVPNDTKALELFSFACEKGNLDGCYWEAFMTARGKGKEKDLKAAFEIYIKACNEDHFEACNKVGNYYKGGWDIEKDYKQGLKYHQMSCESGFLEACVSVGDYYFKGLGVEKNTEKAVSLFKKACEAGTPWGCNYLGVCYLNGLGVEKSIDKALELYQRACDEGYAMACQNIAFNHFHGKGLPVNMNKAIEYFGKACDLKMSESCTKLGWIYTGEKGGPKQPQKAFDLFQQACDLNNYWGCESIGECYKTGIAVAKDNSEANRFFEKACNMGSGRACRKLGYNYEEGIGVTRSPEKGSEFYLKSCEKNNAKGCAYLGYNYAKGIGLPQDYDKALEYYNKAIELGSAWAMSKLAGMYKKGNGVKKDTKRALQLYTDACEKKNKTGCQEIGINHRDAKRHKKAIKAFEAACEYGSGWSCSEIGDYYEGDYAQSYTDIPKSMEFQLLACEKDYAWGCIKAGLLHKKGKGIQKDIKKAEELYKKACHMGEGDGCLYAGNLLLLGDNQSTFYYGDFKNLPGAVDYYSKGCELKHHNSCGQYGYMLFVTGNLTQAKPILEKACEGESGTGCNTLGLLYRAYNRDESVLKIIPALASIKRTGDYTDNNLKAFSHFSEACKLESAQGCYNYASMILDRSIPVDAKIGIDALKESCEMGFQQACDVLKQIR